MGDVAFQMTTDSSQVEAAQQKLYRENVKLREQLGKMTQESKDSARAAGDALREQQKLAREGATIFEATRSGHEKHHQNMERYRTLLKAGAIDQDTFRRAVAQSEAGLHSHGGVLHHVGEHLVALAAGYVGLHAVLHSVGHAFAETKKFAEEAAESSRTSLAALTKELELAGVVAELPRVRAMAAAHGVPIKPFTEALAGVRAAAPRMHADKMQEIAAYAGEGAALGIDVNRLAATAGKIGQMKPDATPKQLVDEALVMQKLAGEHLEQILSPRVLGAVKRMAAQGAFSVDEALSIGLEGAEHDLPRALPTFVEALGKDIPHPKGAAERKFAKADARGRAQMLLNDPKIRAAILPEFGKDKLDILRRADLVTQLQSGSLSGDLSALGGTAEGALALGEEQTEVAGERQNIELGLGGQGRRAKMFSEAYERSQKGRGIFNKARYAIAGNLDYALGMLFTGSEESAQQFAAWATAEPEEYNKALAATAPSKALTSSRDELRVLQEILHELKDQNGRGGAGEVTHQSEK